MSEIYPTSQPKMILYPAAALSLLAALLHLSVMLEHFEEWWGYGMFFLVAALAQVLFGAALLRRPDPQLFILAVSVNLAIIGLWLATRTVGIPFFGPHAWEVEAVGTIDLTCTLAELVLVVALGALLMKGLSTERRVQIVIVIATSALLLGHLVHLLISESQGH
jgi:hypothetical protein